MKRRNFFARTLGALVAAPFVAKAAETKSFAQPLEIVTTPETLPPLRGFQWGISASETGINVSNFSIKLAP